MTNSRNFAGRNIFLAGLFFFCLISVGGLAADYNLSNNSNFSSGVMNKVYPSAHSLRMGTVNELFTFNTTADIQKATEQAAMNWTSETLGNDPTNRSKWTSAKGGMIFANQFQRAVSEYGAYWYPFGKNYSMNTTNFSFQMDFISPTTIATQASFSLVRFGVFNTGTDYTAGRSSAAKLALYSGTPPYTTAKFWGIRTWQDNGTIWSASGYVNLQLTNAYRIQCYGNSTMREGSIFNCTVTDKKDGSKDMQYEITTTNKGGIDLNFDCLGWSDIAASAKPPLPIMYIDNVTFNNESHSWFPTTANWTSTELPIAAGKILNGLTFWVSGGGATTYIDTIEILDASDDSVLSTSTANIASPVSINEDSFDNGYGPTDGTNIKLRIMFASDGETSIALDELLVFLTDSAILNVWINQTNETNYTEAMPTINGSFWDSDEATAACTLYANGTNVSFNSAVSNNTITGFTTSTLGINPYWTQLNCTHSPESAVSGNYSFNIDDIYTAIPAVNFNVSPINISSTTFTEITKQEINVTVPTNLTLFVSMNIKKVAGGATNQVWSRILVDGVEINTENLRTVSGLIDEGSVIFRPTNFTVVAGIHNVSIELRRTGVGTVEANDIDAILIKTESATDGHPIRSNITTQFYNFTSTAYTPAFNWTITKTINSTTFIIGKQTLNKSVAGVDVASFYFRHIDDEANSSIWERYLSSAVDIGSVLGLLLDQLEGNGEQNYTIMSKSSGNMIGANTTIFDMDLRDTNLHHINAFSESNSGTSILANQTFTGGTHNLTVVNFTIQNGSNLFLTATASFKSNSGAQTPTIIVNSSNGTLGDCLSKKERTLSSSADIGVVGIFTICTGLTAGSTYQFNLLLVVGAGESVIVLDETLAGFETEPVLITPIITPEEVVTALLLKIWLLFAVSGMVFFIGGMVWKRMFNGKLTLMLIGNLLLLITSIYSFSIVKVGFGDTAVINEIFTYTEMAILFWGLWLFGVALLFYYTFEFATGGIAHGRPSKPG